MVRICVLLSSIRHTTIPYELSKKLNQEPDLNITIVSYTDKSIKEIEISPDTTSIAIKPLGANSRFDPIAIRDLRELLATGEFDLLHTHHNFVGALGRALAPREMTIVNTEHADHRIHFSTLQNAVNGTTLRRSDCVVANSRATLDSFYRYERLLVPARKRRVIYNGVDLDKIDTALAKPNPWLTNRPRITTVGRLIPTKNHRTLVTAFETVRETVPDVELVIVGDGPERASLEDMVDNRGLGDQIRFTGTVPRVDVFRILDASDVFALSSRSEGFCVALVEAMACGVAPVVSDIPVLHEVADETTLYASPDEPREFASAISRLLNDRSMREQWAADAKKRARTIFPLDRTVEKYRSLYKKLLSESQSV
ncbi:glycosyltransferase family 4 protein [Saliphagus sp. LR7]|uniref:glycosyltransferase family 4 protein n=1 Tax=Saliphagus sp. LR7 TaxID=2282654 RepID=UPI000DF7A742|nr:glycosyltransferase family 4 protein [Saliphagus sp. LR7]